MTPAHALPVSESDGLAPRLRARSTPVPSIKEGILDNDAIGEGHTSPLLCQTSAAIRRTACQSESPGSQTVSCCRLFVAAGRRLSLSNSGPCSLRAEEGDEEGEDTSSASETGGLDFDMEDDGDGSNRRSTGAAADQPGWAALRMAHAAPNARTADAAKLDAARIKSLSAFLGDSLSLGRALSTPIADPPQLTVRWMNHVMRMVFQLRVACGFPHPQANPHACYPVLKELSRPFQLLQSVFASLYTARTWRPPQQMLCT